MAAALEKIGRKPSLWPIYLKLFADVTNVAGRWQKPIDGIVAKRIALHAITENSNTGHVLLVRIEQGYTGNTRTLFVLNVKMQENPAYAAARLNIQSEK